MVQVAVRNLTKRFRDAEKDLAVIEGLSFDFPQSGSVAIVGTSGVGKSTLLHMLGGLDRPTTGEVLYDGVDICSLSSDALGAFRGSKVGFVFQAHHLLPEFNAVENVAMPLFVGGWEHRIALQKAEGVLESVGLKERLSHRPGALSGGEQQRVAIARAIVADPAVILADEPTGNLDPNTALQIQKLLLEVNQRLQNLLIVVTHSPELARCLGGILEMGPAGRLARHPEPY